MDFNQLLDEAVHGSRDTRTRMDLIRETHQLLNKLYFHHASQAKPHTGDVSKQYHAELATAIQRVLHGG